MYDVGHRNILNPELGTAGKFSLKDNNSLAPPTPLIFANIILTSLWTYQKPVCGPMQKPVCGPMWKPVRGPMRKPVCGPLRKPVQGA